MSAGPLADPPPRTLVIGSTWDGHPIDEALHATVSVTMTADALELVIDAPFFDDPAPPGPPGPTAELWRYEVVELFIAGPDERYTEIEVGPAGHHLVLQLDGIREPVAELLPLALTLERVGGAGRSAKASDGAPVGGWRATARLARGLLPPRPWTINAYAIRGIDADRRYLAAIPVPGPQPDFHRLQYFVPWVDEPWR